MKNLVVVCTILCSATAFAQTSQQQNVEVDPVQCWWRTSTPSVRVGEPFTIHLTCSALETDAATAVVDRSQLGTAAVQFPPFEVTSGTQSADHVTAGRRFMQYHYNLRLISEEFFGSDIVIPALTVTYRIESRVQADSAVQGREQNYEMPALTMRINSLVANDARHIREPAVPSLDDIAAREFRARMLRLVAIILFGIAGLTLAVAVVRWLRDRRQTDSTALRHYLPHRTVLASVRRELADLRQQTRAGWTSETLGRALAAARVVASYVAGQPVAQREGRETTGEISMTRGIMGRRRIAVSGSATALAIQDVATAGDLQSALSTLTAARYGRVDTFDSGALDDALAAVSRAADRVARQHTWLAETTRSFTQALKGWAPRAWAR